MDQAEQPQEDGTALGSLSLDGVIPPSVPTLVASTGRTAALWANREGDDDGGEDEQLPPDVAFTLGAAELELDTLRAFTREVEGPHILTPGAEDSPPELAGFVEVATDREGVPSCSLYYELHGNPLAAHRVLFVAGFCTTCASWDHQEYFAKLEDFQVCIFDNRCCGRTQSKYVNLSTRLFAEDARDLLDCIGWQDGVHLVGLSMGGMIAQELALLDPARFKSLTLAVTHAGGPMGIGPISGVPYFLSFMKARSKEAKLRALFKLNFSKKYVEENFERSSSRAERYWGAHLYNLVGHTLAVARHFVSTKRLEQLREAHFPVLIIACTEDRLVRPENSYMLAEFLRADLVEMEGGHMINIEQHHQFNSAVHAHVVRSASMSGKPIRAEDYATPDPPPEEIFYDFSRVEIFSALPRY